MARRVISRPLLALAAFLLISISGCSKESSIPTSSDNFIIFPPTDLFVLSAHDAGIFVEWSPVAAAGFLYYNVYMGTDSTKLNFISETSNNYFYVDSLNYTTTYFIHVTAVYANGIESPPSNFASAKPVNVYAPVQPIGLTVQGHNDASGKYLSVIWTSNPDGDLAGYEVYRGTASSFQPDTLRFTNLLTTVTTNFLKDTSNIQVGREYYYKIIAFDFAHWRSIPSEPDSDMVLQQPTLIYPANDSAVNYMDNLVFQFNQVPGASGYIFYLSSSAGGGDIYTANIPANQNNYAYSGAAISTGELYYWHVAATTKDPNTPNSVSNVFSFAFTQ